MTMALTLLLALAASPERCQMIESDSVVARDVALLVPRFAHLPGEFHIGFLPVSGAPRIFRSAELQRIAKNQGADVADLRDVCFARRTFVPGAGEIQAAMRAALGLEGAQIEVSSWSQHPAPLGELVFPRAGVQPPAPGAVPEVLWHGYVRYGGGRSFPLWARVRITATMNRVVAATNIPIGKPIQGNQVRLESCEDFPLDETIARNLDEVVGYLPKASLRAGTAIRRTQLERAPDVAQGDLVEVQVFSGGAHLMLTGRAQ